MRGKRTEELVEVGVEVCHLAGGDDEREDLPVGVGAVPEVPGKTGNFQTALNLVSDRLDAVGDVSRVEQSGVGTVLTLRDRTARSCCIA